MRAIISMKDFLSFSSKIWIQYADLLCSHFADTWSCSLRCKDAIDCEAAAHIQQLSRPKSKLEEMQKELEDQLLEMSLFLKTLTTLEQMAVVKTALGAIKPNVTAVRAREAMMMSTSLVPTAESAKEPNNKNVGKQRQFFSTKRRKPAASSTTLAKLSNVEKRWSTVTNASDLWSLSLSLTVG